MYPRLIIEEDKIRRNINKLWTMSRSAGVEPMAVVKVFAGDKRIVELLAEEGVKDIGDSRIINLKRQAHCPLKKWLIRTPMLSQVEDVVEYCNVSFQSHVEVIKACNEAAKKRDKIHEVVLMYEMGDLRDGIYPREKLIEIAKECEVLSNIKLLGVGANYNCLNAIAPSLEKFKELVNLKEEIENIIGRELSVVSGGNSSTFRFIIDKNLPRGINQVRTGIGWILGVIDNASAPMEFIEKDGFTIEAEVIEVRDKPTLPWGKTSANLLGEVPKFKDRGMRKRAICALGRQDMELSHLFPKDKDIKILGASSDHLVIDVQNCKNAPKPGDILKFAVGYLSILKAMSTEQVEIVYR